MTAHSDEALKQALALVQEIETQTDRGASIVGAAWVEEELKAAIQSFLEQDKKASDRLFGRSGPLSSFSAKIDLSRLLSIVSPVIASDLHIVREIRNEFAHSVLDRNSMAPAFSAPHITDKCLALRCVAHEKLSEPRIAFIRACAILNSELLLFKLLGETVSSHFTIRAHIETIA
jgi:hypothetical protein